MKETRAFIKQILKFSVVTAIGIWIISLPFLGISPEFIAGLLIGTTATMGNFIFLAFIIGRAVEMDAKKASLYVSATYIFRLMIYGIAFWIGLKVGVFAAVACILGFMTVKIPIYVVHFTDKTHNKKNMLRKEEG